MFKPIKSTRVYEQVIAQIQEMIIDGTLKKGDKLPSERYLAEQLNVSRTSIREAIRALDIIGLIESRQGEGNFIKDNFENCLFEPLSVMFMLNQSTPEEILELRKTIEVEAAVLAAKKITDEQVEELIDLVEQLKNSQDEKASVKVDKEFHYKIVQATDNFLLLNIFNAISTLMESFIKGAREIILTDIHNKEILIVQHENICKALVNRDSDRAAHAMKIHLNLINEYFKKFY